MAEPIASESFAMTGIADTQRTGPRSSTLEQRVTAVYESSRAEIYRYVCAIGLDTGTAQEITQEAFLRLHAALLDRQAIRNERAWLFTVAHNLAINARSRMSSFGELDPDAHASTASCPQTQLESRERLRRLHEAVESLSAQQRQCLELRAEGFRYREIAGILGVGTSTVGEFLRRGIHRLRRVAE